MTSGLGGRGNLRRSSFGSRPRGNNAVTDLKQQQQQPMFGLFFLRGVEIQFYKVMIEPPILLICILLHMGDEVIYCEVTFYILIHSRRNHIFVAIWEMSIVIQVCNVKGLFMH